MGTGVALANTIRDFEQWAFEQLMLRWSFMNC